VLRVLRLELKEVIKCKNARSGKLQNNQKLLKEFFDFFTGRKKQFVSEN